MGPSSQTYRPRHLVIILGDQLDRHSSVFDGFDKTRDVVWMAEVSRESTHVWSSKHRIVLFLSAMRQFAEVLRCKGVTVQYHRLDGPSRHERFGDALAKDLAENPPLKIIMSRPGEYRILRQFEEMSELHSIPVEVREDRHFFCDPETFARYARGRKQLRMEYFYRDMRRREDILMDGEKPAGGAWNFDASNRKSFGRTGPDRAFDRRRFRPNSTTREVIKMVGELFPDHPGCLDEFDWPTNRIEATAALADFIDNELPTFGTHQDAMWAKEPYLSHALLSSSLNLKLINPLEVVRAAEEAYRSGRAPIESVEGFIRQVLGWREYVRGIYWLFMPEYLERNELDAEEPLPSFYWTGETDKNCLKQVVDQTMRHGYAHHIQRLMVTGLYSLLLGVRPQAVHEWYLAVYIDAVEWVELPNTLGMSQYADGGIMASKPYAASGKYIRRMSNYCRDCAFDPDKRTGPDACPFTVLYWDFLERNKTVLEGIPRMRLQLKNLEAIQSGERSSIRATAESIRAANRQGA